MCVCIDSLLIIACLKVRKMQRDNFLLFDMNNHNSQCNIYTFTQRTFAVKMRGLLIISILLMIVFFSVSCLMLCVPLFIFFMYHCVNLLCEVSAYGQMLVGPIFAYLKS
jgi:hypothetical protein